MSYIEIILLGLGLATDASCVCASNGLAYKPKLGNTLKMASAYALFQFGMPVIGFLGASLLPEAIYKFNHIIAFFLLCFIGINMVVNAYKYQKDKHEESLKEKKRTFTNKMLILQAIATSIDALSVGFVFAEMNILQVINVSVIIAIVTFIMCFSFVKIGSVISDKMNSKAELIGGVILIALGIKMLF